MVLQLLRIKQTEREKWETISGKEEEKDAGKQRNIEKEEKLRINISQEV